MMKVIITNLDLVAFFAVFWRSSIQLMQEYVIFQHMRIQAFHLTSQTVISLLLIKAFSLKATCHNEGFYSVRRRHSRLSQSE